jgi:hypothetical protein
MDLKSSFSHDPILNIQPVSRDWPGLRQHAPPYVRRYRSRHKDKDGDEEASRGRQLPAKSNDTGQAEIKHPSQGFEIII